MKSRIKKWLKELVKKHHGSLRGKSLEWVFHNIDSETGEMLPHDGDTCNTDYIVDVMMIHKEGYIDTWIMMRIGLDEWELDWKAHLPIPQYFNIDKLMKEE